MIERGKRTGNAKGIGRCDNEGLADEEEYDSERDCNM